MAQWSPTVRRQWPSRLLTVAYCIPLDNLKQVLARNITACYFAADMFSFTEHIRHPARDDMALSCSTHVSHHRGR
ncbi:hypothetical protein F5Y07DRAFT_348709 [Xylaria sp. FL0933]|nr:hypothetical protein F5Y07DRAFT_348709 [Xylaria sp. FL0933]